MAVFLSEFENEVLLTKRFTFAEQDKPLFETMYRDYISDLSVFSKRLRDDHVTDKELFSIYANEWLLKMFILNQAGDKVGFCLVGFGDNTHYQTDYYIAEFYVAPNHRRTGVGLKAVRELFSLLPGKYCYHVLKENIPAKAFWDHILKACGCIKLFYKDTLNLSDCDFYAFKVS